MSVLHEGEKMLKCRTDGIEASWSSLWMTKEKWESVVLEMPEYTYVDPVMYQKCADKLGMTYSTFWKWYQVWYGCGKTTTVLPFIKTEQEIRERDKRRNRKKAKGVQDLPKLKRRRRKTDSGNGTGGATGR